LKFNPAKQKAKYFYVMEQQKEKKQWKTVLLNRVDKTEWNFPTLAVGGFSNAVVLMHGVDPETGEGHGTVVVSGGDQKEGMIKRTWRLNNFTPVDGEITKVEVEKKEKP
jgi:hypothetical protein